MATSSINIDSINKSLDEQGYGSTSVDLVEDAYFELLNPLRMSEKARQELAEAVKQDEPKKPEEGEEVEKSEGDKEKDVRDRFTRIILAAADDKRAAARTCKAVELLVLAEIIKQYFEKQNLGKASKSES